MTTPARNRSTSTAAKPAANHSPVALDLDTLERENTPEPYTIKVGGRRITLIDIRDLDWQVAASLSPERPFQFVEAVVPEADQEHFLSQKIPLWQMEEMSTAYRDHYGLGDQGNSRG